MGRKGGGGGEGGGDKRARSTSERDWLVFFFLFLSYQVPDVTDRFMGRRESGRHGTDLGGKARSAAVFSLSLSLSFFFLLFKSPPGLEELRFATALR